MTEDSYLDYFTETVVMVRGVPDAASPPSEVWLGSYFEPSWDRDFPARVVLDAHDNVALGQPYFFDDRRGKTEWGASGALQQVILTMAEWGAEGLVGAVAVAALRRLWAEVPAADRSMDPTPVDEDEARARAAWALIAAYELDVTIEELNCLAVERDLTAQSWTVSFVHEDCAYTVVLEAKSEELPAVTKIRWVKDGEPDE